jgi:hypothetical protein
MQIFDISVDHLKNTLDFGGLFNQLIPSVDIFLSNLRACWRFRGRCSDNLNWLSFAHLLDHVTNVYGLLVEHRLIHFVEKLVVKGLELPIHFLAEFSLTVDEQLQLVYLSLLLLVNGGGGLCQLLDALGQILSLVIEFLSDLDLELLDQLKEASRSIL